MKPANPHTLTINGGSSSVAFALFQGACFDWAFLRTLPRVAKLLRIPGHCETFVHIVDSMFNQHAKGLKVTSNLRWRRKVASLNYLLTTHVWRQDHNSFTHQDPGVVRHVVSKKLTIKHGQDLPEIRNWKWSLVKASTPAGKRPARRR